MMNYKVSSPLLTTRASFMLRFVLGDNTVNWDAEGLNKEHPLTKIDMNTARIIGDYMNQQGLNYWNTLTNALPYKADFWRKINNLSDEVIFDAELEQHGVEMLKESFQTGDFHMNGFLPLDNLNKRVNLYNKILITREIEKICGLLLGLSRFLVLAGTDRPLSSIDSPCISSDGDIVMFNTSGYKIVSFQGFAIFQYQIGNHKNNYFVGHEDLLTLIHKARENLVISLVSKLDECIRPSGSSNPGSKVFKEWVEWGCSIIELLGNKGYNLIKVVDTLILEKINSLGRNKAEVKDAFPPMGNSARKVFEEAISEIAINEQNRILKVYQIINGINDSRQLSELYGRVKAWGAPYGDSIAGYEKVKKEGRHTINPDPGIVKDVGRLFKELFSMEYFKKHQMYPKMEENKEQSYLSDRLLRDQVIHLRHSDYLLQDWDHVNFLQTFPKIEGSTTLDMLDDKALSNQLTNLIHELAKGYTSIGDSLSRNIIVQFLKRDHIEHLGPLLEKYGCKDFEFLNEHLITILKGKEEELKIELRLFALLTYDV